MKITFLVLTTVFLASDIIVAAPGRDNETGKSQLDMILLQMERQKDQIIEEQERKSEEQQRKNEEQQRQIEELQHQLKEFKINRALRSESDIVKELKKLIHAEINGLSQCVAGNYTT